MSESMELSMIPLTTVLDAFYMIGMNSSGVLKRIQATPWAILRRWNSTDLNTLTEPGLYTFTTHCANCPPGVNMAGALVFVWSHTAGYVSQLVLSMIWQDGGIYYRSTTPSQNGNWWNWRKFAWTTVTSST